MNAELKNTYIEEESYRDFTLKDKMTYKFKQVSFYEAMLDKDAKDFTVEDIVGFYKYLNTPSIAFLYVYNQLFQNYTTWCMGKGVVKDFQNHYTEITDEVLKSCLNLNQVKNSIFTRKDIDRICFNEILNYRDGFIIYAVFEGLTLDEISEVKISDFNGNKVTTNAGRVVEVSDKLYHLAVNANTEIIYKTFKGGDYSLMGNTIVKYKHEPFDKTKLTRVLTRLQQQYNAMLSANRISLSGKIDYIKTKYEEEGANQDLYQFIMSIRDDITQKYSFIPSIKRFLLMYQDFILTSNDDEV